jgi:tetratricopeptide (TPR) repeat protein
MVLNRLERFDEAIPIFKKAIRLNPVAPINYLNNLAWAYTNVGHYEKAISLWDKALKRNPNYLFGYTGLTIAFQWSGQEMKAREAAAEVLRIKPAFSISQVKKTMEYKNEETRKRILEAYRRAGIPEHSFQKAVD